MVQYIFVAYLFYSAVLISETKNVGTPYSCEHINTLFIHTQIHFPIHN